MSVLLMPFSLLAQMSDYGFERSYHIPVYDTSGLLTRAWEGGLNGVHFNQIDLDLDGDADLVIFDKAGDRILPYLNTGSDYEYAPEYAWYFPEIFGWIQLVDYNCDGKNDLFAYAPAGIQVWKNISDTELKFKLMTPLLNSYQGAGYSNIALTYVDYPGIVDVDADGDLDIFVFFGLGAYVLMHRNMAMETVGNCDTLLFERTFYCWGNFAESASSNHLFLDIVCPWRCSEPADASLLSPQSGEEKAPKHTGSTMLMFDANGDSLTDMVLGDVDYLNLTLLINGGSMDTAHMVSADTLFPSNSLPVNLVSFPLASYIDVNHDSIRDLLVSPFDPNPAIPKSHQSVWYYTNSGQNNNPVFNFQQDDFLQGEMIDAGTGSYPVMFDQDGDGLQDLVMANYGVHDSSYMEFGFLKSVFISKLALYRNTGSTSMAEFTMVDDDFAGLSSLKLLSLFPAFADLDGDGDQDMVCGESKGSLLFFENTAGAGNPAVFGPAQTAWQGIDVGDYSAPALVDLNGDGKHDLVIGKRDGMLRGYLNTGTTAVPAFSLISDTLGGVNVTDYTYSYTGYSTPHFFRDSANLLKLFVGSEQGRIRYYKDIEGNLNGIFTSTDSILMVVYNDTITYPVYDGARTAVTTCNLNGDLYPDMLAGNLRGGLNAYTGCEPKPFRGMSEPVTEREAEILVFPNPFSTQVTFRLSSERLPSFIRLEIFDLSGRSIRNTGVLSASSLSLDLSGMPDGIYFYSLVSDQGRGRGKIVKCGAR